MKTLILGGTGLLGSSLVPKLLARGHEVSVLSRNPAALSKLETQGVKGILGDLLEPEGFISSLTPHDVVVSIAMPLEFGRMSRKRFELIHERTTKFTYSALDIGRKLECPIIFTLGTSYRTGPGEVADETWPIERFGITKVGIEAERLIHEAGADGQPIIQMIPGQIYGPGGMFLEMYNRLKSGRFGIVGKGDNHVPRIHVEDCAEAFALVIDKMPANESFIVADDTPCTVREFTEFMASCAGMSKPRTIPKILARIVLGKLLLETMEMDCIVSNDKVKQVLGLELKYPSYREGLPAAIKAIES
ncbi:MAG: NAD-dependent epimerase/dehydratase family protein [Candidatus Thorarchaeota archaeon]|nr:MAG: NAD-dependent epimerase/dehydratase family protein [Candidatus Thorarchaeota archaeon]